MNMHEYNLILLMEECAEVAQQASKQFRFGRDEVQPGLWQANHERLRDELLDVLACVKILQQSGQIEPIKQADVLQHMNSKQAKINRMLGLSRTQGLLADAEPTSAQFKKLITARPRRRYVRAKPHADARCFNCPPAGYPTYTIRCSKCDRR